MRQTVIATALVVAIVAILGATVANSPRKATVAGAGTSIDVMQMMKDAKNLPDQAFDAH
jgi:hypothetical protein